MRVLALILTLSLAVIGAILWWSAGATDAGGAQVASRAVSPGAERHVAGAAPIPALARAGEAVQDELAAEALRVATEGGQTPTETAPKYDGETLLRGRVVDADLQPIAGARILTASRSKGPELPLDATQWSDRKALSEAASDAEGRFRIEGHAAGPLRLAVRAAGFAPLDLDHRSVPAELELDLGDLVLSQGVRLAGQVTDTRGVPVGGARLIRPFDLSALARSKRPDEIGVIAATSAADGSFVVDVQAPGPWTLLVHSEEHVDRLVEGSLPTPGEERAGLQVALERAASIEGVVVLAAGVTRPAPEEITVSARYSGEPSATPGASFVREAACDAGGRFHIGGLLDGEPYALTARSAWGEGERTRELGPSVDAVAGEHDIEIHVGAPRTFVVRAVDASTGAALDEYAVRVAVGDGRGRSLETGEVELGGGRRRVLSFEPLEPGALFSVELSSRGYRTLRLEQLTIEPAREVDLGDLRLEPLAVARVRVIDLDTGAPLEGARVEAELQSGDDGSQPLGAAVTTRRRREQVRSAKTGPDGIAELYASSMAAGLACATHESHARSELFSLQFGAPPAEPIDVALGLGASVEVLVLDANGATLPGARVRMSSLAQQREAPGAGLLAVQDSRTSDGAGLCRFESLPSARYVFWLELERVGTATAAGRYDTRAEYDLVDGQAAQVTLTAPVRVRVHGRVTEAGLPVVGATLTFAPSGNADREGRSPFSWNSAVRTRSDEHGRYELLALGPGGWTVAVEHPTRLTPHYAGFEVESTDVALDLALSGAAILGRVVGADGRGIEGARVVLGVWKNERNGVFVPLFDGRAAVVSDSAGEFALRGLPRRAVMLEASLPGFQIARSKSLAPAVDETLTGIELVLRRGGRIALEVVSRSGSSLRGRVTAQRLDGKGKPSSTDWRVATSNAAGIAHMDGLAPGRWRVSVWRSRDDPKKPAFVEVEVEAGRTARASIEVP